MRALRILAVALLASPLSVNADPAQVQDSASIINSGIGYEGNLSVNQAAGDQQQQSNVRALSLSPNAHAQVVQQQSVQLVNPDRSLDAASTIGGSSFHGSGVLGVNQASGLGNQQINAMHISISTNNGPLGVDDNVLAQSVAITSNSGASATSGMRVVSIDNQAFSGSSGVVQVNQSAGVGNQSSNSLGIRVAGGL